MRYQRDVIRPIGFLLALSSVLTGCAVLRMIGDEKPQPVTVVSSPAEAQWSSTTQESASTSNQRQVLFQARKKTITGEVVDVSCFLQLGKRGEAHISCGQKCVRNGQPIGVLTDQGKLYLIIPEEHHPRRDGKVTIKERFAELMGKRVQISGMVTSHDNYRALFVRTLPKER